MNKLRLLIRLVLSTLRQVPQRLWTRFSTLSKRAKRLLFIQLLVLSLVFGGIATKVPKLKNNNGHAGLFPPSVEIPYSTFLRLVEAQPHAHAHAHPKASTQTSVAIPYMGGVTIGSDRINYFLFQKQQVADLAAIATATPTTTTAEPVGTSTVLPVQENKLSKLNNNKPTGTLISSTMAATADETETDLSLSMSPSHTVPVLGSGTSSTNNAAVSESNNNLSTKQMRKQQAILKAAASSPLFQAAHKTLNVREDNHEYLTFMRAFTRKVTAPPELIHLLQNSKVSFTASAAAAAAAVTDAAVATGDGSMRRPSSSLSSFLNNVVRTTMVTFYFFILWRLYRTMSKASGGSSQDSPGKLANTSDLPLASFDDIEGIDKAKLEVMELVDTLRNPDKYAILGARAPTGLLLEGPPGTGKTMLARATAASAGVPLLYCSGSDFVEMFVGRGAARVRKLFERAGKLSPCLIFIDELDALGKSRVMNGLGRFGGSANDEAEQTLNQLLACMDGLDSTRRICVMAATNRKEVLDPALIRPGRFDRIVRLELPDAAGRERILRVHCRKLPAFIETQGVEGRPNALGKGRAVDLSAVAAVTAGLSGAELEFLVNEAAIRAVRRVSAQLREQEQQLKDGGGSASANDRQQIVPHVEAQDFEASVADFFATRRKSTLPNDLIRSIWQTK